MAKVILDTHVLVWWVQSPEMLSKEASRTIDSATQLGIATISFWEIALLVRKGRLDLDMPLHVWIQDVCAIDRVEPIPLGLWAAVTADSLDMHPDPADRFIVATAQQEAAPLISKDRLLNRLSYIETIW